MFGRPNHDIAQTVWMSRIIFFHEWCMAALSIKGIQKHWAQWINGTFTPSLTRSWWNASAAWTACIQILVEGVNGNSQRPALSCISKNTSSNYCNKKNRPPNNTRIVKNLIDDAFELYVQNLEIEIKQKPKVFFPATLRNRRPWTSQHLKKLEDYDIYPRETHKRWDNLVGFIDLLETSLHTANFLIELRWRVPREGCLLHTDVRALKSTAIVRILPLLLRKLRSGFCYNSKVSIKADRSTGTSMLHLLIKLIDYRTPGSYFLNLSNNRSHTSYENYVKHASLSR